MKSLRLLLPLTLIATLAACGGKGSSAPAPTDFRVQAQDSQLHMTWTALPGAEYWVFCAPNASTIDSHTPSATHSGWYYFTKIYSGDHYATGLSNGTSYACTVNGRYDGGPGGADATPVVATPAYAGATWSNGNSTALTGMTVRSVAVGLPTGLGLTADQFVAVGAGGNLVVSSALAASAAVTWGTPSQAASAVTADLNAVSFYAPGNRFVAVGDDGQVVYATSTSTWTAVSMPSATGVSMKAVASSGSPLIAVGGNGSAQGVIYSSADSAGSWSQVAGISTNTLHSVVYVPDATPYWIAVGNGGVVLRSTDGATWATSTPAGTAVNFTSVAVLPVTDSSNVVTAYRVVAVGDHGTVLMSTNGTSWTSSSLPSSPSLVAVFAAKGQFMAVDAAGMAYTSNASNNNWAWSAGVATGQATPLTVMRYTPSFGAVSNGWMVFDSTGAQKIAR